MNICVVKVYYISPLFFSYSDCSVYNCYSPGVNHCCCGIFLLSFQKVSVSAVHLDIPYTIRVDELRSRDSIFLHFMFSSKISKI